MVTFLIRNCSDSNQMLQLNIKMRKQKMYRNCIEISHIYHSSFSAQSYVHNNLSYQNYGHTVFVMKMLYASKNNFWSIWTDLNRNNAGRKKLEKQVFVAVCFSQKEEGEICYIYM